MAYLSENMGIKGLLHYLDDYKTVIDYCIADGSYSNVILDNHTKLLVSCHLKLIENCCPYHYLIRINKSVLVNLNCIIMIDYNWYVVVLDHCGMFGISDDCMYKLKAYLRNYGFIILPK
jgi:DNA-binding LytR/AlgR family response regulator